MGNVRVNGERFELPQGLCGDRHIHTAVMRRAEYIGVSIEGARFDFGHAAMRLLLQQLSDPSRNGEGTGTVVQKAFDELQHHFEGKA